MGVQGGEQEEGIGGYGGGDMGSSRVIFMPQAAVHSRSKWEAEEGILMIQLTGSADWN